MSAKGMRTYSLDEWCEKFDSKINIPKIQRGFVWKAEQIAGLWDSLLRGFPIGSFMVQPKSNDNNDDSVDLLDGQQRGRSIAGGVNFKSENGFRVWIASQLNTANEQFTFDIQVTTDKQPFGLDNKFKKLSVNQRSKAYEKSLCKKYPIKDDINENNKGRPFEDILGLIKQEYADLEIDISLSDTEPYNKGNKDIKYVALDKLFAAIKDISKSDVYGKVKSVFEEQPNTSDVEDEYIRTLANALLVLKEERYFYAIEVDSNLHKEVDKSKDIDIEVLFKRVGTSGTALSDLDFAYSLLKQRLEGTEKYINNLLSYDDISSLFSSLDCVDILIRTSCFQGFLNLELDSKKEQDPTDNANCNKKLLYKKINANKDIIQKEFESIKIKGCLVDVVAYLKFDAESHSDGLPIQLLQKLPKKLWQMFVILFYAKLSLGNNNKDLSKAFVRIALYWLLVAPTSEETANIVHQFIELIKKKINSETKSIEAFFDFEFELINLIDGYSRKNNASFAKLIPLSVFKDLTVTNSGFSKDMPSIIRHKYKLDDNNRYQMGILFWWNKNLLLWLQRNYLNQLNNEDTLKVLSDFTLYDFDHIIPQHLWAGNSKVAQEIKSKFFKDDNLWEIGHSIGNFQLLKFTENRSKASKTYPEWMSELEGNSKKDKTLENSILKQSHNLFSETVKEGEWNLEQSNKFVQAVEMRIYNLYREFLTIYDEDSIYFYSKINPLENKHPSKTDQ